MSVRRTKKSITFTIFLSIVKRFLFCEFEPKRRGIKDKRESLDSI